MRTDISIYRVASLLKRKVLWIVCDQLQDRLAGANALKLNYCRQPTLWLHKLFLEVLTLCLFWAKTFHILVLLMLCIWHIAPVMQHLTSLAMVRFWKQNLKLNWKWPWHRARWRTMWAPAGADTRWAWPPCSTRRGKLPWNRNLEIPSGSGKIWLNMARKCRIQYWDQGGYT